MIRRTIAAVGVAGLLLLPGCSRSPSEYDISLRNDAVQTADVNSDGVLQTTELAGMLRELGYKGVLSESAPYWLRVYDESDVKVERGGLNSFGPVYGIYLPKTKLEKFVKKYSK
jgi:hypothetical protein